MSQINTNGINVNYPVPGQNNSSQGFRDNFAAIRTNINTASTEITDLQAKVVVKAAKIFSVMVSSGQDFELLTAEINQNTNAVTS